MTIAEHAIGAASIGSSGLVSIDSATLPVDSSVKERDFTRLAWERTSGQRDVMIAAMVGLFKWLNGGVYGLVVAAWIAGIWLPDYRIVDAKTLMTLIAATVAQPASRSSRSRGICSRAPGPAKRVDPDAGSSRQRIQFEDHQTMTAGTPQVHHLSHPLIQHKLTLMREKERSTYSFRTLMNEIAMLIAYEVTRDMTTHLIEIETPLEKTMSPVIDGKKTVFVSILRAGNGFLDGMLSVVPGARVGHVGLYRDPKTLGAIEYYFKMPHDMHERDAIVLDPMLATGNSAIAAVDRLKETRPRSIRMVCLLAAPEGLKKFGEAHPDVPVYTAAIDRELNSHGYIVPGLGDAGDRLFGTK